MSQDQPKSPKKKAALSKALRANLAKRKAQTRALNPKKTKDTPAKTDA